MAMHPGNGNGFNSHDMPQHLGMVPQNMNSNGYQHPPAHAMHMGPSASLEAYQPYHPHQAMQHPPLQAAEYQPHQQQHQQQHQQPQPQPQPQQQQQPPPQHVKRKSYDMDQLKNEMPISNVERSTNRKFRLDVLQQPERARMCGYGDKDRRPITPPPCIRVVITDAATGEEVNYNDIDCSTYVLMVDLWDKDGRAESNLCRQPPSTSGTASTTPSFSYAPMNNGEPSHVRYASQSGPSNRELGYQPTPAYVPDYSQQIPPGYGPVTPTYPPNGTYGPPTQYFPQTLPSQRYDSSMIYTEGSATSVSYPSDGVKGMMSRNLIGSVVGSAAFLVEPEPSQREGIWFVLQDLSVRLEGDYCLKFTFVNVAETKPTNNSSKIAQRRVPELASCFSSRFKVYSAKRFPGVFESTPLSKAFAEQGVKIPIRKTGEDGREIRGGKNDDDEIERA